MKKFWQFWIFLLIFFGSISKAQSQQNDFATWNYVNLKYKFNENLYLNLAEHMLRNENATELWLLFHDISLNQWISPHFTQELHFRLMNQKELNDNFIDKEVIYYAMNGQWKLGRWQLGLRSRWQGMAYGTHLNDEFKGPYFYHRGRLMCGTSFNYYWKSSLTAEFFQPINRPNRQGIDQVRYGILMTNTINKRFAMDYFFQLQQQKGRKNPYQYFVLGIGCNFVLSQ